MDDSHWKLKMMGKGLLVVALLWVVGYIIDKLLPIFRNPSEHITTIAAIIVVFIIVFFWKIAPKLNYQSNGIAYILIGSAICTATYYRELIYLRFFYTPPVIVQVPQTNFVPTPVATQRYVPTPEPTIEPTPDPSPTLFPEPPAPTNFISYGSVKIRSFRVYTKHRDSDGDPFSVYAQQFPAATTKNLYWKMEYGHVADPYIIQIPVIVIWKLNGEVWSRTQLNLTFTNVGIDNYHSYGFKEVELPVGKYDIDTYWGKVWLTHTDFEVY